MGYECWRAMYEAWVRNYPESTGVFGWMLNSCWPSLMWQMYDYHNNPLGAFYGTQKACEPLHVQYAYDDHSIWAVNQTPESSGEVRVRATIFDLRGKELWHRECRRTFNALGRAKCFAVPKTLELPKVYFLSLELHRGRKQASRNVYWLSNAPDQVEIVQRVDQKAMKRPQKAFADFKSLARLPKANVEDRCTIKKVGRRIKITLTLTNGPEAIAFFLWPRVVNRKTGALATPVCWSDNCVTLMPSERVNLTATLPAEDLRVKDLAVTVAGRNTG